MLRIAVTEGRVLPARPLADLAAYVDRGGGRALAAARAVGGEAVLEVIAESGLRGRGGAGFPTAAKWRTVAEHGSSELAAAVVVNAAEGEPWTEKDRAILLADPYQVLEGALIGAQVVGAHEVVVALRGSFEDCRRRVEGAIAEMEAAEWCEGVAVRCVVGPEEYLFGEETALLEVLAGRPPMPRIAPPFRRGVTEVVGSADDVDDETSASAHVEMAGQGHDTDAPPALVDNVETLAHVPWIVADGPDAFRARGTDATPGTVVCTVTGAVREDGLGEVAAGTTVRAAIEAIAGGFQDGTEPGAVVVGASTRPLTPGELDTPLCFEALGAIGSGLGSATIHVVAAGQVVPTVAGISRFLAVESCGQCEPCKRDGLALADALAALCSGEPADEAAVAGIRDRVDTVADGARCALARQQEAVVAGLLDHFADEVEVHLRGAEADVPHVGDHPEGKQPDWTYDEEWSGATPADALGDHV